MRDRLVTLAMALGAILALYILLGGGASAPQSREMPVWSTHPGDNGYLALDRWLNDQGVPTASLTERYDQLDPSTSNLLIITLPHRLPAQFRELQDLHRWVEHGNSLLVLAALRDSPAWANAQGYGDIEGALSAISGFDIWAKGDQSDETEDDNNIDLQSILDLEPIATELRSSGLLSSEFGEAVQAIGQADPLADPWFASTSDASVSFPLLAESGSGQTVMWGQTLGQGRIILSSYSGLFNNSQLGSAENAELFAQLLAWAGADGMVIFDDMHQGLSVLYDPDAFFSDRRLHTTIILVLLWWLIWVVGSSRRLVAVDQPSVVVSATDHVRAIASLYANKMHPQEVTRRLERHFERVVRHEFGLSGNDKSIWESLRKSPRVATGLVDELQAVFGRNNYRPASLARLHKLVTTIRKQIR